MAPSLEEQAEAIHACISDINLRQLNNSFRWIVRDHVLGRYLTLANWGLLLSHYRINSDGKPQRKRQKGQDFNNHTQNGTSSKEQRIDLYDYVKGSAFEADIRSIHDPYLEVESDFSLAVSLDHTKPEERCGSCGPYNREPEALS